PASGRPTLAGETTRQARFWRSEWRGIFPATTTASRRALPPFTGIVSRQGRFGTSSCKTATTAWPRRCALRRWGWTPAAGIVRGARQLGRTGKGTPPAPASQNQCRPRDADPAPVSVPALACWRGTGSTDDTANFVRRALFG